MISAADMDHLDPVPDDAKLTAMWLWLNLDPLGRGLADPEWIAERMHPRRPLAATAGQVETHLLQLMDAGFLTTYQAEGCEWLLLLHPLKVDLRGTRITTPDPPGSPWSSVAVGRGSAGGRELARERARERVRAEDAARASAWDAVREDREEPEDAPVRPLLLDAPPMFCDEHMPHGAGRKKCGPCRDARLLRDEWMTRKVYEEKLATYLEQQGDEEPW